MMNSIPGRFALACVSLALMLALAACGGKSPESYFADAQASHAKGDRQAAIVQLKNLLHDAPDHVAGRRLLGVLYNETGDHRSAEKELRRALELKADPAAVMPELARALFMQGEFKKVLDETASVDLKEAKASSDLLAVRGNAQIATRAPADARASFERALTSTPGHPEATLGLARLSAGERKLDEALAIVDKVLAADQAFADAWMLKGDILRAAGRAADAAAAYESLVKQRPTHVAGLLALVSLEVAQEQYPQALARLEVVRKADASNPMATYFQALIEFRRGNNTAARDAIQQVLKVAPTHLPSNLLSGAVEFALGAHEQAQARLRFVLERTPANLYARRLLIASLTRTGQTQRALEALEPALKAQPSDPALLALAGEVHMQLNEYGKAREFFERAAQLDPKSAAMRTGLGLSRLAGGDVDRAAADLESASKLDSDRTQADVLLISTHLQRRQWDQALKAAENLIRKQPKNPQGPNLKAAALVGMKDFAGARKALEQALELAPGYTPAATNLAQLDLQAGDPKAARRRFENILATDNRNAQALLGLASLGPRIGATPQEIIGWLEAARKASPGAMQPLVMLTRHHLQSGEPKRALELVEQALAAAPENPEVLDIAGQVQLAAGERNRALSTYGRLVSIQPQSPIALMRLATAQAANENFVGAAGTLRKALGMRADFIEAQLMLAEVEVQAKRPAAALEVARGLQKQQPKSPLGWALEGDVLMADRKPAEAVKAYETAWALGRSGPLAVKLQVALGQVGRAGEGEAKLGEWLRQHPADHAVRLHLAESQLKAGRFEAAKEQYEAVIKAQPDNVLVVNNLAWVYQQTKDKRALETAERAFKLRPDLPAVLDTLGLLLVEQGDAKRGVDLLAKAASAAPKAPDIRFNYALGLSRTGDRAKARQELESLLVEFPKFPKHAEAVKLLAELRK